MCPLPGARRFFDRAGGMSYRPGVETRRQGRRRSSLHSAVAECVLKDEVYNDRAEVVWEDDQDARSYDPEQYANAEEVLCAGIKQNGRFIASLCGIDDPSRDFVRIVEADLAAEAWPERVNAMVARSTAKRGQPVPLAARRRRR